MKKLIAILTALCLLSGYPLSCISEVEAVFADTSYSPYVKLKALEVVTEQLERQYNCIINEEPIYGHNYNY